jgi:hypothetical protein
MRFRPLPGVVATVALVGLMSAISGASPATPYTHMKTVIADANAETSMRYTVHLAGNGKSIVMVTDASRVGGRQVITLTVARKSNTVIVELIAGALYVKGDAAILSSYMGLSTATSKQLSNKWFSIPKSNADYATVSQAITISSTMTNVTMNKSVIAGASTTLAGVKVDVLKGKTVPSSLEPTYGETLYVSTSKTPLPVEATQTYQGSIVTLRFGHWDETIHLVVPNATLQLN